MVIADGDNKRVLVVDDEPWGADILARMLTADGHAADIAPNGAAALEMLREGSYDVIVCDLRPPESDGPGFYASLERERPDLLARVVFMSSRALTPAVEGFLERTGVPCGS